MQSSIYFILNVHFNYRCCATRLLRGFLNSNGCLNNAFWLVENLLLAILLVNSESLYTGQTWALFLRVILWVPMEQVISVNRETRGNAGKRGTKRHESKRDEKSHKWRPFSDLFCSKLHWCTGYSKILSEQMQRSWNPNKKQVTSFLIGAKGNLRELAWVQKIPTEKVWSAQRGAISCIVYVSTSYR